MAQTLTPEEIEEARRRNLTQTSAQGGIMAPGADAATAPKAPPPSIDFMQNGKRYKGRGREGIMKAVQAARRDAPKRQLTHAEIIDPRTRVDDNGDERDYVGNRVYRDANGNRITEGAFNMRARSETPEAQAEREARHLSSMSPWERKYYMQSKAGIMAQKNADRDFDEGQRQFDEKTKTVRTKNEQDFDLGKLTSENNLAAVKDTNATNKSIEKTKTKGVMYQADKTLEGLKDTNAANQSIAETRNNGIMYQADKTLEGVKDTNAANKEIAAGHDDAQVDAITEQGVQNRKTLKLTSELTPQISATPQGERIRVGGNELDEGQTRTLLAQVDAARNENGTYDKEKLHAIAAQYGMTGFWDNDRWEQQLITLGEADYRRRYAQKPGPVNTGIEVR